jgi:NADH-quinone oxidoreductase subunit E
MSLLSPRTLETITALRQRGPTARSALLAALRLAQQERGHVGPAEVEELAGLLDLTPAVVDGAARFYDQITGDLTGHHVVALCRGIACFLRGGNDARQQLEQFLGVEPDQTTGDRQVTFRLVECIGDCDHAPAVMLDDAFLGAFSQARLAAALAPPKDGH